MSNRNRSRTCRRMMRRSCIALVIGVVAAGAGWVTRSSPPAQAVGYALGFDASWPQCGTQLPSPAAFAVIGVNRGQPGTVNPCLRRELWWGKHSQLGPRGLNLYINSSNPGPVSRRVWPKSDMDRATGSRSPNPFGKCGGHDTLACSWQYGWNMAEHAAKHSHSIPLASHTWWLDVETMNVWQRNRQNNRAVLGGMATYLMSRGAVVGIYSTRYQWQVIAGTVTPYSVLYTLPEWITGASTITGARRMCSSIPLSPGGRIVMTQWFTARSRIDGDFLCPLSPERQKVPAA